LRGAIGGFSVFSFQFSVFSFQFSVFSFQFSVFSFRLLAVGCWVFGWRGLKGAWVEAGVAKFGAQITGVEEVRLLVKLPLFDAQTKHFCGR
jgi:hypothetical protein